MRLTAISIVAKLWRKTCLTGNYPLTVGKPIFYFDSRLGGVPNAIFGDPGRALMRLPDDILECVAFIVLQQAGDDISQRKPIATGFFLSVPGSFPGANYIYL